MKDLAKEIERVRKARRAGRKAKLSDAKLAKKYGLSTRGQMPLDYILGMATLADINLGDGVKSAEEIARDAIKSEV